MIRLHREGRWIILLTIITLLLVLIPSALYLPSWVNYPLSLGTIALLILVLRFFRKPHRRPFLDEKTIVAPADGRVVVIEKTRQEEFLGTFCIQVSIFMSIHDVHINYYPAEGKVAYVKYHPGKYLVARHPKSSHMNERNSVGIETSFGPLLVTQVAGYVARRIRCYTEKGFRSRQGREMGFIRFGSRLDLFLPPDVRILVKKGEKVTGSVSPVARFK